MTSHTATERSCKALVKSLASELTWAEIRCSEGGSILAGAVLDCISSDEGLQLAQRLNDCLESPRHFMSLPEDLALVLNTHFASTTPSLVQEDLVAQIQKSLQAYLRKGAANERDKALSYLMRTFSGVQDILTPSDTFRYARILSRVLARHGNDFIESIYSEVSEESKPYLPRKEDITQKLESLQSMLTKDVPTSYKIYGFIDDHRYKLILGASAGLVCGLFYWRWRQQ